MNHLHRSNQFWPCFLVFLVGGCWANDLLAQVDSGFKFIEIKVVDPDGKPLADVEVDVNLDNMQFPMPTDEEGLISLNVPSGGNSRLSVKVKHKDYVADVMSWRGGDSIPEEHTIKLEKGIAIGGIVHDQDGNPVEGVKVIAATRQTTHGMTTIQTDDIATTDGEGRWQAQAKNEPTRQLLLRLTHEDYISRNSFSQLATWDQLKTLDHIFSIEKGIELVGTVTDPDGEPIAGAIVFLGSSRYVNTEDKTRLTRETDEQGKFHFGNVTPGATVTTVAAWGWAPSLRTVTASRDAGSVDFQLQPGRKIRVRVTDPDDIPIAGVGIAGDNWRGHRSLPETIYRGQTDEDGIWECNSMPDEAIRFDLFARGHMSSRNNLLKPGDEPQTIVMAWPLTVFGKVVDAESGLPLESFTVVQGIDWGNGQEIYWERYNQQQGSKGKYSMEYNEPRQGHYVRVEADGYRPAVSRKIMSEEGEVRINFELEEGSGPQGKIFTPDGKPAADAELLVATPQNQVMIHNGHAQQHEGRPSAKSDASGKYQLPFLDATSTTVVCRHDSGYARVDGKTLETSPDINLTPWAAVEGTVYEGDQPLANEQVQLYFNNVYVRGAPRLHWSYNTQTDDEGKFRFDHVICDEAYVARTIRIGDTGTAGLMSLFSHTQSAKLVPGETATIDLGGEGGALGGRLRVPDDYTGHVAWSMASVRITEQLQAPTDGIFKALGRAIGQLGNQQPAPRKRRFTRTYASAVDELGNFAIADVAPGAYRLRVDLYQLPENDNFSWQPIGTLNKSITIPEIEKENDQDPIDLGELMLQIVKPAVPGPASAQFYSAPVAE